MNNKIKFIVTAIIISAISSYSYLIFFRAKSIGQDLFKRNTIIANNIINLYKSNWIKSEPDKSSLLENINKNFPQVASLIIVDKKNTIKLASKNLNYIKSEEFLKKLIENLKKEKFTKISIDHKKLYYFNKYYNTDNTGKSKLHVFLTRINKEKLILIFPHRADRKIMVKTGIEILIVISISLAFLSSLFISKRKKIVNKSMEEPREINLKTKTIESEASMKASNTTNAASETLSEYIFSLFKKIEQTFYTDSISLYIMNPENTLLKHFELKGSSFIKFDSNTIDSEELNPEIGNELKNSSVLITDAGSAITLPLIDKSSLMGTIKIKREQTFNGNEINTLKYKINQIVNHISDFLTFNNLIIDKENDLYSKTFFKIKFSEYLNLAEKHKKDFSIVMISIDETDINIFNQEKNKIIKLITPTISQNIDFENYICNYDDYIAVLLPGVKNNFTDEIKNSLLDSLSRFQVRIESDIVINLSPRIGASSTDILEVKDNIIFDALEKLHTRESVIL